MRIKEKNLLWYLTFPFAHKNYTTIGKTIYYPKDKKPSQRIIDHEYIHYLQQKKYGLLKFLFLYLFAFPLFYNPWRYKWEYEAYKKGSHLNDETIRELLSSYKYGWLKNNDRECE